MPSDAERIAEEIVSAANVTTCDGYYEVDIDAAAAVIERAIADAVAEREALIVRALRLYPEWCKNWGMDHNMNVAIQAANECADMLATLPAELPEDDDEAASAIFKTLPWWIEANARANTPRGDHKERQENGNDRQ